MTEAQEKFLRVAAQRLPLERVVEVHLFPPIRNGGLETGIAIVAVERSEGEGEGEGDGVADAVAPPATLAGEACDPTEDAAGPAPVTSEREDEDRAAESREPRAEGGPTPHRHTVYTARYRLTLKGADRGKFEVDVQEEADAPLVTIDLVVRGVQQRANEPAEPDRIPGERLREIVAAGPAPGTPGRAA